MPTQKKCDHSKQSWKEACQSYMLPALLLNSDLRSNSGRHTDTKMCVPASLRVNRLKVVNALKRIQKHNPFYRNIKIKEENFDWMNGAEEVNMGSDGVVLNMKESARLRDPK